jgi:D-glycero-alpha-D-manno-heptose-7-phosphate kinase
MIIVRAPLRITLGGGGTDIPSYADRFGGYCITAAINQYVYVAVSRPFKPGINLKYSQIEAVRKVDEVKHPIIREALDMMQVEPQIDIVSLADIPAGTGLGSSSSFTVALIAALAAYKGERLPRATIAEMACTIEIDRLREPIGRQDQYAAAYGGIMEWHFTKDEVGRGKLHLTQDTLWELEDNLLLFFTGFTRDTRDVMTNPRHDDFLSFAKEIGKESRDALVAGDLKDFAALLHEYWQMKGGSESSQVGAWYDLAIAHGALGGKLVGAGGGGFLMFYTTEHARLRRVMQQAGLEEVRFRFDFDGVREVMA